MFRTHPPLPSLDELLAFLRDDEAKRAAIGLRADLAQGIRLLRTETLLALARQFFPGETDYQAIVKFGLEATAALRELAAHGEDARMVLQAENARMAPMRGAAASRSFKIVDELRRLDYLIRQHEASAQQRRKALMDAGVKGDDLEHLVPADGLAALQGEQVALRAEQDALERFIATGDERHLPAGFTASDHIKAEVPRLMRAAA